MNEGRTVFAQLMDAISVYVLVAIVKKKLQTELSLYTILQVLSISLFQKIEMAQALSSPNYNSEPPPDRNQLQLFDLQTGR